MTNLDQFKSPNFEKVAASTGKFSPRTERRNQMSKWAIRTEMESSENDGVARSEIRVCDKIIDDIISLNKRPFE